MMINISVPLFRSTKFLLSGTDENTPHFDAQETKVFWDSLRFRAMARRIPDG